jgi:hypothetical protein
MPFQDSFDSPAASFRNVRRMGEKLQVSRKGYRLRNDARTDAAMDGGVFSEGISRTGSKDRKKLQTNASQS